MPRVTTSRHHAATGQLAGARWRDMLIVSAVMLPLCWALQYSGADLWIADRVFQAQGGHWAAREAWWASQVLHTGARKIMIFFWILLFPAWLASMRGWLPAHWRGPLGYLLATLLTTAVVLGMLKRYSGVDCPWDLLRYGGTHPYLPLFSGQTNNDPPGTCFPAAHAGVGYAWVALWFALGHARTLWRCTALGMALALGALFGMVQQIRGAHFLSHDLCSLALAWLVAALMSRRWFGCTDGGNGIGSDAAEVA